MCLQDYFKMLFNYHAPYNQIANKKKVIAF